jgi:hypothetical protein
MAIFLILISLALGIYRFSNQEGGTLSQQPGWAFPKTAFHLIA